jgi:hypothetical protein
MFKHQVDTTNWWSGIFNRLNNGGGGGGGGTAGGSGIPSCLNTSLDSGGRIGFTNGKT